METRPGLSSASPATPATLSDVTKHSHEPLDTTMAFEYTEQLLTPENSRSETSSNNENASNEENPTLRRRSTRVTRASRRGGAQPEVDSEVDAHGLPSPADTRERILLTEKLVNGGAPGEKRSRSSHLRHSIAIMESALQAETKLVPEAMEIDDHPMAPDTPVSKSSQEPPPEDVAAALQPRTLRKRVERALAQDETHNRRRDSSATKASSQTPTRRSSRLIILEKVSDIASRATSILGKRSRGKEPDRRSSLRPRHVAAPKEEPTRVVSEPPAKKRRVSDSEIVSKPELEPESAQEPDTPVEVITRFREKRWLTHGLYTGQEYTRSRPSQNRHKSSKRKSLNPGQDNSQRRFLPMPMFVGERLLQIGRDFQLPFDIYSPLPPGQPKPNEWRKTNKNVFVGEAGSIWRASKELELSKCMCTEDTGCDQNCQNRYMFYECDDSICGLGPECGNRSFEDLKQRTKAGGKYNIGVEVIKTEDRGYGVRSNRTFEPDQIIVEYTGEIITQAECEKRMRTVYKKNECYYLMYFDQNMIIDATRGSMARFVNHSCQPNCRMEKWTVAGKPRMALFAGDRGIMTGEELTYDYNFDPYSQKNVQQCRCGAPKCRGILGPRPREKEQRAELRAAKLKELADAKKAQTAKRRAENARNRRRALAAASIKSGVKKAVSRARATVSKARSKPTKSPGKSTSSTSRKPANASPKTTAARKTNSNPKEKVKLPKIKATKTKARAPVRSRKPAQTTKVETEKTSKSPSKVKSSPKKSKAPASPVTKSPAARKQPKQPKKDILKTARKTIVKGTTKQSPKAKDAVKRTKAVASTSGGSPGAKKTT
ncbi:hypothetical protein P175DRAFT_0434623 [Aspergillus ochraceoroseus IBT 24754]|uniref:Histone-lysine N-methyltransferase n=2 Tax=Aspergillus ochraceoroseus TaxID=138278 RepID=A0A2T5M048_9EURO|nr:uncharacterized protein P175DRAFT_0434623 [Aspergillus ochraceoroseus IBT 24754]KKK21724.1 hypothetical protein AOCH_007081 [Aspergillus ochraceoroseus]PTU21914.1 hypothetical protein P175DRAFT_0434623 [Aspergillus ochraceoroseus IBT 24754]